MSYASPSDGTLKVDFTSLTPPPFIAWLHKHGLLHPGSSWTCEYQPRPFDGHDGPVFYRRAEKIAGGLIVRPKRESYV